MKYYLKLFLLSIAIGLINLMIFINLLKIQIIHNSSYVPYEIVPVSLINVVASTCGILLVTSSLFTPVIKNILKKKFKKMIRVLTVPIKISLGLSL